MNNPRVYGSAPFSIVVVHGGPGAPGEMRPVAEELSKTFGVIEPLQTKNSVDGQVEELKNSIKEHATIPVYLVGWSWGAWLSYLVTARYPDLVKKLILVSGGPFEKKYVQEITKTRLARLSDQEKKKIDGLTFDEFGSLIDKADSYDSILHTNNPDIDNPELQSKIYEKVWPQAEKLRKNGELLEYGKKITCPVVAIHGDYDPHPAEGVKKPLSNILKDFHFYLLKHCGHHPWFEKQARDKFYEILRQECI
jgi:pimeloyl-ACP methyl ester carboxylesterase